MEAKGRRDIGRAMSMADAAPMLSTTPRGSQLGSAFQDGDGAFDASYSKMAGAGAGPTTGGGSRGGSSSTSRKPGRCVCCVPLSFCSSDCCVHGSMSLRALTKAMLVAFSGLREHCFRYI